MPKEYIVRLVFDRRHRAVALCRGDLVRGIAIHTHLPLSVRPQALT